MPQYTPINSTLIDQIAADFMLGKTTQWKHLEGGSENTNVRLKTEAGEFVLTICEQKSMEETMALAHLLEHLEQHGFTTTRLVKNTNGKYVQHLNGKPILLKEYLPGEITTDLNETQLLEIGKAMGELHQIPPPSTLPDHFSYGQQAFGEVTQSGTDDPFVTWLSKLHGQILENTHPDLPKALIHGDIFDNNIIVNKNQVIAIMDFEEACYYYRVFDLGMAIIGSCTTKGNLDFSKARFLLKGYLEISTLEEIEKEKLPIFTAYAAGATAFWRYRQYRIRKPEKTVWDRHLAMQALADQALARPAGEFMELAG